MYIRKAKVLHKKKREEKEKEGKKLKTTEDRKQLGWVVVIGGKISLALGAQLLPPPFILTLHKSGISLLN